MKNTDAKIKKVKERSSEYASRLSKVRKEITAKRALITQALVDGKPIDELLRDVATLQIEESGLIETLASIEKAESILSDEQEAEELKQASSEMESIEKELSGAALQYLRDAYRMRSDLESLLSKYARAKELYKKYPDELSTWKIAQYARILSALQQSLHSITRNTEIAQPDLIREAGLERRF